LKGKTLPPETPTPQNAKFTAGGIVRLTESSDTHIGLAFPGVSNASPDYASIQVLVDVLKKSPSFKSFSFLAAIT